MSFSERRYESYGVGEPIFGIRFKLEVGLNTFVPIIPNIGSRCKLGGKSSAYRLSENNMPAWQLA